MLVWELWQTGYMHNRVRMIVGSFLVKNLLNDWRGGKLGSGIVYLMRVLLVIQPSGSGLQELEQTQHHISESSIQLHNLQKFDPDGTYIRKFIPKLKIFLLNIFSVLGKHLLIFNKN